MSARGTSIDGASVFRRAFHIASPVFLGYFLLPESLAPGLSRTSVTLLFLGTAWCIEIARIALRLRMFGMRDYEGDRVSAYAQGSLGLAVGLFLVQDPRIVVPVFVGMAWIDPLAAFARRQGWSRGLPAAAYAGVFLGMALVVESLFGGFPWPAWVALAALATGIAIAVEGPRLSRVDDDLLMQLAPMGALAAAVAAFAALGLL